MYFGFAIDIPLYWQTLPLFKENKKIFLEDKIPPKVWMIHFFLLIGFYLIVTKVLFYNLREVWQWYFRYNRLSLPSTKEKGSFLLKHLRHHPSNNSIFCKKAKHHSISSFCFISFLSQSLNSKKYGKIIMHHKTSSLVCVCLCVCVTMWGQT